MGATVATLRALARSPYTGRMHNWVAMVHGDQLIRKLAVNQLGLYPPAVQQAASELKVGRVGRWARNTLLLRPAAFPVKLLPTRLVCA